MAQKESEWKRKLLDLVYNKEAGYMDFSELIQETLSTREKEIAEEVERLRINCPCGKFNCHGRGNDDALDDVLQILKHQ